MIIVQITWARPEIYQLIAILPASREGSHTWYCKTSLKSFHYCKSYGFAYLGAQNILLFTYCLKKNTE